MTVPAYRWEKANVNKRKSRRNPTRSRVRYYLVAGIAIAAFVGYLLITVVLQGHGGNARDTSPVILYVNQWNGVVNASNFGQLLDVAKSHGFNTIFFQVYRSGTLLFTDVSLSQLVASAHGQGFKIFLALYFTDSSQKIPSSVYADGEDGINLDMSTLTTAAQTALFNELSSAYPGKTAVTTTDPSLPLNPNLLIVETYGAGNGQYIHHGMIASVGVFATTSHQDYVQQLRYAPENSEGVMVFDYAGLIKAGY